MAGRRVLVNGLLETDESRASDTGTW
jgi:hypothetical protein